MPQHPSPIAASYLDMAVKVAISAKGQNSDWIGQPDKVAAFIETIARKLYELSQG